MRRSDSAISRQVGDDVVLLDVQSGRYFSLNASGVTIWDRLETDAGVNDLVEAVVSAFDVDRDTARRDVEDLVQQLHEAGLVTGVT